MTLRTMFEFVPIILAIVATTTCSYSFMNTRRRNDRIAMIIGAVSAMILILVQTSWWVSSVVENNLVGTTFANNLWTVFNTLIMICLILYSRPWSKK